MTPQTELALKSYYRKSLKESVCMILAMNTGRLSNCFHGYVHVLGMYPNYKITLTGFAREQARKHLICMDPHFDQPSILGAAKLEYGNL